MSWSLQALKKQTKKTTVKTEHTEITWHFRLQVRN